MAYAGGGIAPVFGICILATRKQFRMNVPDEGGEDRQTAANDTAVDFGDTANTFVSEYLVILNRNIEEGMANLQSQI